MNNIKEISVQSLNEKINNNEKILLIDVREDAELKISKISQSIHIPMKTIPYNLKQISTEKTIIIMCKTGGRSSQVCEYFSEEGQGLLGE